MPLSTPSISSGRPLANTAAMYNHALPPAPSSDTAPGSAADPLRNLSFISGVKERDRETRNRGREGGRPKFGQDREGSLSLPCIAWCSFRTSLGLNAEVRNSKLPPLHRVA